MLVPVSDSKWFRPKACASRKRAGPPQKTNMSFDLLLLRRGIDEVSRSTCTYAIALMNVAEGVQDWLLLQNCLQRVSSDGRQQFKE